MLHVTIRIPSNFRTVQTGLKCPSCGQEIDERMKHIVPCHKIQCPSCSNEIMVHVRKSRSKKRHREAKGDSTPREEKTLEE